MGVMLIVDVCGGSVDVADVISVNSGVVQMDNLYVQDTVVDANTGAEDGNGGKGWKSGAAGVERGAEVLGIDPSRVETNGTVPYGLGRYPVGAATMRVKKGGDGGKVTTGLGRYPVGAATTQT